MILQKYAKMTKSAPTEKHIGTDMKTEDYVKSEYFSNVKSSSCSVAVGSTAHKIFTPYIMAGYTHPHVLINILCSIEIQSKIIII